MPPKPRKPINAPKKPIRVRFLCPNGVFWSPTFAHNFWTLVQENGLSKKITIDHASILGTDSYVADVIDRTQIGVAVNGVHYVIIKDPVFEERVKKAAEKTGARVILMGPSQRIDGHEIRHLEDLLEYLKKKHKLIPEQKQ